MDLALNNLQCLICHKTQPNQPSSGLYASSPSATNISLCSESELYSMLLSGPGKGSLGP